MHPAYSVIVFTTASGAGYGLLIWLAIAAMLNLGPRDPVFGFVGLGVALALITTGLLTSTVHLGRPERAWRAFSQWRSSWLSREGIASLMTFVPTGLFGIGWIVDGRTDGIVAAAGVAMAAASVLTVVCTGMIYACLKPIAQWSSSFTMPAYLIFALMTGAVLLDAILALMGSPIPGVAYVALIAIGLGWIWKLATWRHNDSLEPAATLNSATGLAGGTVRSVEWPHTEQNYLLKEMGYRIARKHAAKLRLLAQLFGFALPLLATAIAAATGGGIAKITSLIAVLTQAPGMLVERWLFFAEARHTVTLYYGLEPAS
jgi:DMSO reductase anchor subunit